MTASDHYLADHRGSDPFPGDAPGDPPDRRVSDRRVNRRRSEDLKPNETEAKILAVLKVAQEAHGELLYAPRPGSVTATPIRQRLAAALSALPKRWQVWMS